MTPDGVREKRKNQTREALCAAAVEIVGTDGLDALTAERIAEVAGVSRRTLFNYFARVEDVLSASMDTATAEMCGQVIYPAAVLKTSAHPAEAQAFLDYLSTPQAMAVFEAVGFAAV